MNPDPRPRPFPPVRCTARSKRTQLQCRRFCAPGARVCYFHGGAIPKVKARAAERVLIADALRTGEVRSPHEVLASALVHMDRIKEALVEQVSFGDPSQPVDFERLVDAIDRAAKLAKVAIDVGIEERQVRVSEAMALQLAGVMRSVLGDLGLSPAQQELVGPSVAKHIAALTGRRVIEA